MTEYEYNDPIMRRLYELREQHRRGELTRDEYLAEFDAIDKSVGVRCQHCNQAGADVAMPGGLVLCAECLLRGVS